MSDDLYEQTIRDEAILGPIIGSRVVDITQHDRAEYGETGQAYVCLHFDTGHTVTFYVSGDKGFDIDDMAVGLS